MPLNNTEKYTICDLFESEFQFSIPSYQRAYAWEVNNSARKHVRQFLSDLEEQHPNKDYYLGHFLFEDPDDHPGKLYVIDGQQRLTTIVIFFSCLIRELERRLPDDMEASSIWELDLHRMSETYLRRGGKRRFTTVESDEDFFAERILDRSSTAPGDTRSRRRIAEADDFFTRKLKTVETLTLVRWARVVETAAITTYKVRDKVQATQIFSFQNDRGKGLTDLEKLKAFLIYQVYLHSEQGEENEAIKLVERRFADIYVKTEEIAFLDEDQILLYHCIAYLEGCYDGALDAIKAAVKAIEAPTRVEWVKRFSTALRESFQHVKALETLLFHHESIADPIILNARTAWPLLMKLYKHFGEALLSAHFAPLLRAMELTLFKLQFLHGNVANQLHWHAKKFNGEADGAVEELQRTLEYASRHSFRGGQDCGAALRNALMNWKSHFSNPFAYLLWKYENSLRARGDHRLQPGDFIAAHAPNTLGKTIDHIAPQDPEEPYSQEFITDSLNNIGNLVYMTRSLNSRKRNKPPLDLSDDFWDTSCASHREIREIIMASGKWDKEEIEARKRKITAFALERWEAQ